MTYVEWLTTPERVSADVNHAQTIMLLASHSDRGVKRRPSIKGSVKVLNEQVQEILRGSSPAGSRGFAAAILIENKVREAYRVREAA